ncbi:hypothetical protein ACN27F_29950 [Solwaraspora sp. WMMB335]|uniref:hypothetical protein n=1 Tax=Solwaraspora sp. WMMB335 TaxID=3404118 RepID=UPI003B954E6E
MKSDQLAVRVRHGRPEMIPLTFEAEYRLNEWTSQHLFGPGSQRREKINDPILRLIDQSSRVVIGVEEDVMATGHRVSPLVEESTNGNLLGRSSTS